MASSRRTSRSPLFFLGFILFLAGLGTCIVGIIREGNKNPDDRGMDYYKVGIPMLIIGIILMIFNNF